MAYIERRQVRRRTSSGRVRMVGRYKVRYRDPDGRAHSETKDRLVDAERRKAEIEIGPGYGPLARPTKRRRAVQRMGRAVAAHAS